jgi:hypothetical protein
MPNTWHPLLAAHEISPGVWQMIDDLGEVHTFIRRVLRGMTLPSP